MKSWYPWNSQTLKIARELDKPIYIFISQFNHPLCQAQALSWDPDFQTNIYSTSQMLFENFIPIHLDTHIFRPTLSIFQSWALALIGNDGIPLNIFTTPDLQPFYTIGYTSPGIEQDLVSDISSKIPTQTSPSDPTFFHLASNIHAKWTDTSKGGGKKQILDQAKHFTAVVKRSAKNGGLLGEALGGRNDYLHTIGMEHQDDRASTLGLGITKDETRSCFSAPTGFPSLTFDADIITPQPKSILDSFVTNLNTFFDRDNGGIQPSARVLTDSNSNAPKITHSHIFNTAAKILPLLDVNSCTPEVINSMDPPKPNSPEESARIVAGIVIFSMEQMLESPMFSQKHGMAYGSISPSFSDKKDIIREYYSYVLTESLHTLIQIYQLTHDTYFYSRIISLAESLLNNYRLPNDSFATSISPVLFSKTHTIPQDSTEFISDPTPLLEYQAMILSSLIHTSHLENTDHLLIPIKSLASRLLNHAETLPVDHCLSRVFDKTVEIPTTPSTNPALWPYASSSDLGYLVSSFIDYYVRFNESKFLETATSLQRFINDNYWNSKTGGYNDQLESSLVLVHYRNDLENSYHSSTAINVKNMIRLSNLLSSKSLSWDSSFDIKINQSLSLSFPAAQSLGASFCSGLVETWSFFSLPPHVLVVPFIFDSKNLPKIFSNFLPFTDIFHSISTDFDTQLRNASKESVSDNLTDSVFLVQYLNIPHRISSQLAKSSLFDSNPISISVTPIKMSEITLNTIYKQLLAN